MPSTSTLGDVQPVVHDTFVIERNYLVTPEKVFSAFAQIEKKRGWYSDPSMNVVEVFELDFRPGGTEHFRYRLGEKTPLPGMVITNESYFHDIVENRRIVWSSTMSLSDKRISATLVTIELEPSGAGAKLICTHQGAFFEGADGPKMREQGWCLLFDRLEKSLETL